MLGYGEMSEGAFGGIEKTVAEAGKIEINIRQVFARGAAGKFLDRINRINRIEKGVRA